MKLKNIHVSDLSESQNKTLNSLTYLTDNFFKIDYYSDFKIDEILNNSKDGYDVNEIATQVLIPNTPYHLNFYLRDFGCTCFTCKSNLNATLLGRNYDMPLGDHLCAVCETKGNEGYNFIGALDMFYLGVDEKDLNAPEKRLQFLYSPLQVQDGINEKGLACALLFLNEHKTVQKTGKTPLLSNLLVCTLLNKASCVKEACEILKKYDFVSLFKDFDFSHHYIMCDTSGDMAIIEYINNKLNVIKSDNHILTLSNYYKSLPVTGQKGIGFLRVSVIEHLLKSNPNPSNEKAMAYLEAVKYGRELDKYELIAKGREDYQKGISYWSEIFDTNEKSLKIVFRENFNKIFKFKLC